jgi:hypothetical protein
MTAARAHLAQIIAIQFRKDCAFEHADMLAGGLHPV